MTARQLKQIALGGALLLVALLLLNPPVNRVQAIVHADAAVNQGESASQDKPSSSAQKPAQEQAKTAEETYKNIRIFKGLPASGVMRAMTFFTTSLGVDCTHCHVAGEFEKDDKPPKQTARKMYEMVQLSNKVLGSNRVSCYACHRGHVQPEPPSDALRAEFDEMMKKSEQDKRPAEQVYKNVQTLKGVPAGRWMMIMTMFTKSLGVDCTHCHVQGEFEKDDKPAKMIARKMLGLTGAIAREIYKGPTTINCYTCHRGQPQPVSFPSPTQPANPAAKPVETKPPEISRSGPMPTADQVLDNHVRATGGTAAFAKIKTRVLKGSLVAEGGFTAPIEIYARAPDKMLMIMHTPGSPTTVAFNGKTAWQKNENGLREMVGPEAEFLSRQARSFAGSSLKDQYAKLEVMGRTKLGEREALVLSPAAAAATERLYFDAQTGLLIRQDVEVDGPQGKTALSVEYADYREVDGVKLPFSRRWSRPGFTFTQRFDEIKHNVAIDDARFEKPAQ
jgi:photosynthetic reaction center cytochrome c subunit